MSTNHEIQRDQNYRLCTLWCPTHIPPRAYTPPTMDELLARTQETARDQAFIQSHAIGIYRPTIFTDGERF